MKFSQTKIKGMIKKGIFGAMALLMMLSFGCSKEELVLDQVQADGGKKGKTVRVEGHEIIGTGDEVDPKGPIGPDYGGGEEQEPHGPFRITESSNNGFALSAEEGIEISTCAGVNFSEVNTKRIAAVRWKITSSSGTQNLFDLNMQVFNDSSPEQTSFHLPGSYFPYNGEEVHVGVKVYWAVDEYCPETGNIWSLNYENDFSFCVSSGNPSNCDEIPYTTSGGANGGTGGSTALSFGPP